MLLAQMLQEEEDARAALNNPAPVPGTTGKKGTCEFYQQGILGSVNLEVCKKWRHSAGWHGITSFAV